MEDLFKKFIYTGIGWVSSTTDKLKKSVEDFIAEGKLSAEDGKKIVDEFLKNSESKKGEIEDQFNKLIDHIIKSMSFVKMEELKKLEKRVSQLEEKLTKTKKKEKPTKKSVKSEKKTIKKQFPDSTKLQNKLNPDDFS